MGNPCQWKSRLRRLSRFGSSTDIFHDWFRIENRIRAPQYPTTRLVHRSAYRLPILQNSVSFAVFRPTIPVSTRVTPTLIPVILGAFGTMAPAIDSTRCISFPRSASVTEGGVTTADVVLIGRGRGQTQSQIYRNREQSPAHPSPVLCSFLSLCGPANTVF